MMCPFIFTQRRQAQLPQADPVRIRVGCFAWGLLLFTLLLLVRDILGSTDSEHGGYTHARLFVASWILLERTQGITMKLCQGSLWC